jgi:hypothetical protein
MAMDLTFGFGVAAFIVAGLILIALNYFGPKAWGAKMKKAMAVAGVLLLVAGSITYVAAMQPASSTQTIITPNASFNSVCAAPSTHTTIQNNSHIINIAMSYNSTSKLLTGSTDVTVLNFTISRADSGIADAVATCSLGNVPIVGIVGSTAQPIVAVNSDNTYKAAFAKAGGFSSYQSGTVLVSAGSSGWMTCTLTLNSAALAGMSQYQVEQIPLSIGGQSWIVNAQLVSITT